MAVGGAAWRRVRLRTSRGTWLLAHASPLSGQVALMIEPAKVSEIAPVVIEAYGLTPREVDVTRLAARALSTDEIASNLLLSPHGARPPEGDLRGELTSKLFAKHYQPAPDGAIYESSERVAATMRTVVGSA